MDTNYQKKLFPLLLAIGIFPFIINGYVNSKIINHPALYWAFELLIWVVLPISVFYIANKKGGLKLQDIGIHTKIFNRNNLFLLIIFCSIFSVLSYHLYLSIYSYFSSITPSESFFSYKSVIPDNGIIRFIIIVYFALAAGIVEEFYYRGFMHKTASLFSNPIIIYLAISPILFSIVHWESGIANLYSTYVFGFIFALCYLWLKNLWPLITGHIYTDYVWFS